MPDGDIGRAINALAAAYDGLKVANGYRFNVQKVFRRFLNEDSLESLTSTPVIMVGRPPGSQAEFVWHDERLYRVNLPILVVGFIRGSGINPEEERLSEMGEQFLSDMVKLAVAQTNAKPPWADEVVKNATIQGTSHDGDWDTEGAMTFLRMTLYLHPDVANP